MSWVSSRGDGGAWKGRGVLRNAAVFFPGWVCDVEANGRVGERERGRLIFGDVDLRQFNARGLGAMHTHVSFATAFFCD